MRLLALAAASLLLASPLSGQEQELTRPDNWKVRFDRAGTSDTSIYYVDMPPGWHITTGQGLPQAGVIVGRKHLFRLR